MKYTGKEQIKKFLLKCRGVYVIEEFDMVHFIGSELEGAYLKLEKDIINDIIKICKMLDISYYIG